MSISPVRELPENVKETVSVILMNEKDKELNAKFQSSWLSEKTLLKSVNLYVCFTYSSAII